MFEEKIAKLEEIIERIEDGETPLEDAITLYKDGTNAVRECGEILQKFEEEVAVLTKTSDGFLLTPFAEEA